jgi:hypothetical protein
MLCCSCGIYFSAAASSERRQHELGFEYRLGALYAAIKRSAHPAKHGMADLPLNIRNNLPCIGLVPAPIEVFGDYPQLDDKIAGQIRRFGLAALFAPEPQQGFFVLARDDASIRASNVWAPIGKVGASHCPTSQNDLKTFVQYKKDCYEVKRKTIELTRIVMFGSQAYANGLAVQGSQRAPRLDSARTRGCGPNRRGHDQAI